MLVNAKPLQDGFSMPAEWAPQQRVWMIWPERTDNWRDGAVPAQQAFTAVAKAIAEFEPVTVAASAAQYDRAQLALDYPGISVVEISSDDAWARDTGPTFVSNGKTVRAVDWRFNAWGGENGGLYASWEKDERVAAKMAAVADCDRYAADFVLEGGSIHVDGEGTLITTEECLLNPNRNPHLSRADLEQLLGDYLGVSKVIWLPEGLYNDETDGHVDNCCCFVAPGELVLAWTDDPDNPNYGRCRAALSVIEQSRDARGRELKVHKMPLPSAIYATEAECEGVEQVEGSQPRTPDEWLAGSYVNFLLVNGGVIMPRFDDPADEPAQALMQQMFPDRKVVALPGREILLGGGNIHCITQQQPMP